MKKLSFEFINQLVDEQIACKSIYSIHSRTRHYYSIQLFNSIRYFVVIRWALDLFRRINLSTGIFLYVFYVVSALFARAAVKWVRA